MYATMGPTWKLVKIAPWSCEHNESHFLEATLTVFKHPAGLCRSLSPLPLPARNVHQELGYNHRESIDNSVGAGMCSVFLFYTCSHSYLLTHTHKSVVEHQTCQSGVCVGWNPARGSFTSFLPATFQQPTKA